MSLGTAELYEPTTGMWSATGSLATARRKHTATLLPNGKVLVVGGVNTSNNFLRSAELYDPATGMWSPTPLLAAVHSGHTATLLPNGKVLVAGNFTSIPAELYDPASGTWSATGNLGRAFHTATLLPNGKVLVAGGDNGTVLATAELYDPVSGTWSPTGNLVSPRERHTATLLPNGKVLVAAGFYADTSSSTQLASAELYDPATGIWSSTQDLPDARTDHTLTLLPNGKALVVGGGSNSSGSLATAELYDPASGTWSATASLPTDRSDHTATLLLNGKLLVAAGFFSGGGEIASALLYDIGLNFDPACQPQISTATSPLTEGSSLTLTGSRFKGVSSASASNDQDSATNYPIVKLRSIDSSQVVFLPVSPREAWSDTSFKSAPVG